MKQREGIGRARLAANGDQHAAAAGQRLEDAAVVRLKADAPHGARKTKRRQIAGTLQRGNERPVRDDRANRAQLDPIGISSERFLDQRRGIVGRLREDGGSFKRKTSLLQRIERLCGPGGILKDCNREKTRVGVDHSRR